MRAILIGTPGFCFWKNFAAATPPLWPPSMESSTAYGARSVDREGHDRRALVLRLLDERDGGRVVDRENEMALAPWVRTASMLALLLLDLDVRVEHRQPDAGAVGEALELVRVGDVELGLDRSNDGGELGVGGATDAPCRRSSRRPIGSIVAPQAATPTASDRRRPRRDSRFSTALIVSVLLCPTVREWDRRMTCRAPGRSSREARWRAVRRSG